MNRSNSRGPVLAAIASVLLAGCASFSEDGGFRPVRETVRQHLGHDLQWARSDEERRLIDGRVATLLAEPLSMDSAVQLALLNHRGLQGDFHQLGVAEADLVQAGRLPNPGFSFGRLRQGDEREIERALHLDLGTLLTMPWRRAIQERRFAQAQADATQRVLSHAAATRRAWVQAVAARQSLGYARQVMQAAQAGAELAGRMAAAGNFNKLQQAREQAFYADAATSLARAEREVSTTREQLIRLLGLWGEQTAFRLPERLPDLPEAPRELPEIERLAIAQRLDVQAARLSVEQTARELGLGRVTRFVDAAELGLVRNSSNEAPRQTGWEIGLQLPLFDWGGTGLARARSVYLQSAEQAAQVAIDARSEVRESYADYRSAWDIARHHRDEVVPLRQRIADENLLRYNGMLIGVFELLADARAQIAGVDAAIQAQRDFWLADASLQMALLGKPPAGAVLPAASAPTAAADAGGGH